jgi:hypothetical protein
VDDDGLRHHKSAPKSLGGIIRNSRGAIHCEAREGLRSGTVAKGLGGGW